MKQPHLQTVSTRARHLAYLVSGHYIPRRMKAAYSAYEEREVARLKQEKPGLKLSQYKEQAFKAWQKSPENPVYQARLAEALR